MLNRIPGTNTSKKLDRMRRAFKFIALIESAETKLKQPLVDKEIDGILRPGLAKRLGALCIDNLALMVIFLLTLQVMKHIAEDSLFMVGNLIIIFIFIVSPSYASLCNFIFGGSLGKLVLDVNVVSSKDNKLSLLQSLLREVSKLMLMPIAPVSIFFAVIKNRRVPHDFLSSTSLQVKTTKEIK